MPRIAHADLSRIHCIEQCSFRAWPAPQTTAHGAWVFRLAGGFTKRANSVNATQPNAPFAGIRTAAEAFYAQHGQPAVFRLSPLASEETDAALEAAGYRRVDPSRVLVRSLQSDHPPHAGPARVEITSQATPDWLDGFATANGVPVQHQPLHHAMVCAIVPACGFATLRLGQQAIGFGLAVRDGKAVGFYDIVIDPAHRLQGHGIALVQALMHWGRSAGAGWAYLQVRDQNPAARQLYAQLGFTDLYPYHYRVPM